jgi:hypothetical protein
MQPFTWEGRRAGRTDASASLFGNSPKGSATIEGSLKPLWMRPSVQGERRCGFLPLARER